MIVIAFLLYLLTCLKDQVHKYNLHDLFVVLEFLVLLVVSYEWPTPSASSVQFSFFRAMEASLRLSSMQGKSMDAGDVLYVV